MSALDDIAMERRRHTEIEGWTPEHDDKYVDGQLAKAAACYALDHTTACISPVSRFWPWALQWWKPTTTRRNLVRAGALIVAEIERLDRAEEARTRSKA